MRGSAQFGPLVVAWTGDVIRRTFECVFGADARTGVWTREPDIVVCAERVRAPVTRPGGAHQFYSGEMKGWVLPGEVILADGRSEIRISDGGRRIGMRAYPGAEEGDDPEWIGALPTALAIAARSHGVFHIHAAHVALGGRSLIIVGDTCAGKSTTAVGLCELGARWAGDDLSLVTRGDAGDILLWSVARWFHLREATAARFPRVAAHAVDVVRADGRKDVDPRLAWPERRIDGPRHPDVIVLPSITDQPRTVARPASADEAIDELLLASAMIIIPGSVGQMEQLALLSDMISSSQVVSLTIGRDGLDDPLAPALALSRYLDEQ